MHFVTQSPDAPTSSAWQPSAPARSEGGRGENNELNAGTVPPALVYKHRAIYDRRRAKLNPGTEQQDLADNRGLGAAGLKAPFSVALSARQLCARGATRRDCRARLSCGRDCLCLGEADGAPASALSWPGEAAHPSSFSGDTRHGTPRPPSLCFSISDPAPRKLPGPEKKKSTSVAEISDKS